MKTLVSIEQCRAHAYNAPFPSCGGLPDTDVRVRSFQFPLGFLFESEKLESMGCVGLDLRDNESSKYLRVLWLSAPLNIRVGILCGGDYVTLSHKKSWGLFTNVGSLSEDLEMTFELLTHN